MAHWAIPHDETHRFLDWGLRDEIFNSWREDFNSKGIAYEIGGGRDSWTIYKHLLYTNMDSKQISRCCPMEDDL